jgi:hypothetical protein
MGNFTYCNCEVCWGATSQLGNAHIGLKICGGAQLLSLFPFSGSDMQFSHSPSDFDWSIYVYETSVVEIEMHTSSYDVRQCYALEG